MPGKKVVKRGRKCVQKTQESDERKYDNLSSGVAGSSENKKRKTQVSLVSDSKVESCTKLPADVNLKMDHIRSPGNEELGEKSATSTNTGPEEPVIMSFDGNDELTHLNEKTTLVETSNICKSYVSKVVLVETHAEVVETYSSVVDTRVHAGTDTEILKSDDGEMALGTQISAAGTENPLHQIDDQDTHRQTDHTNCEIQEDPAYGEEDLSINPDCVLRTSEMALGTQISAAGTENPLHQIDDQDTHRQNRPFKL